MGKKFLCYLGKVKNVIFIPIKTCKILMLTTTTRKFRI